MAPDAGRGQFVIASDTILQPHRNNRNVVPAGRDNRLKTPVRSFAADETKPCRRDRDTDKELEQWHSSWRQALT